MTTMQWRKWLGVAALGVAAAMPARADVVAFEDLDPTLFSGSAVTSGDFDFTSSGIGFSGVDTAAGFLFGNAPANSSGQFLFMLNADTVTMARTDGAAFFLDSFAAAFIAPVGDLGAGILPGELWLDAQLAGGGAAGESFVFPESDDDGFSFTRFRTEALRGIALTSVSFAACIYISDDECSFVGADTPPQFALDNFVPEPASAALALGALALLGFRRRGRSV